MSASDNWLVHEHSLYEDLLSRCQDAVEIEDWSGADFVFRELVTHLKRHMALEEEVLYAAYETAGEAPQGPTTALRVIKTRDSDHVLECLLHLEKQMIKHHEKEEDIFLPMASHILGRNWRHVRRILSGNIEMKGHQVDDYAGDGHV
jgi:hemerythrin-like domain-containing protein